MDSRRFFGFDPFDHDDFFGAAPPRNYTYDPFYSHHQPAASYFPAVDPFFDPVLARRRAPKQKQSSGAARHAKPDAGASMSFPIPIPVTGPDPEPKVARVPVKPAPSKGKAEPKIVKVPVKPAPWKDEAKPVKVAKVVPARPALSKDAAAVRLQAAARGFLARKAVRVLRAVAREAEAVTARVAREAEAMRGDATARVRVGEELMRLLLRLDAVRGARDVRRRVARRVLALQDAVDALDLAAPEPAAAGEEAEAESTTTDETAEAEGNAVAADVLSPEEENNGEVEDKSVADVPRPEEENDGELEDKSAVETADEMEVDGDRVSTEDVEEPSPNVVSLGGDKPADEEDEDGQWEMVAEEPEATPDAPQPQESAGEETTTKAGGATDTMKLMEMVAALCEQSAQQYAMIGALAERLDALERKVRRVEDAKRRRQAKKFRKGSKGSSHIECYSD